MVTTNQYPRHVALVDACNQEVISVEDIYEITDSLDSLSVGKPQKKSKVAQQPEEEADLEWPPQEEEFLITLDENWMDSWLSASL